MWTGPNKEGPLLPKSDGDGRMISAMQLRDFGFGLPMSADQLAQVNVARANISRTLTKWLRRKYIKI